MAVQWGYLPLLASTSSPSGKLMSENKDKKYWGSTQAMVTSELSRSPDTVWPTDCPYSGNVQHDRILCLSVDGHTGLSHIVHCTYKRQYCHKMSWVHCELEFLFNFLCSKHRNLWIVVHLQINSIWNKNILQTLTILHSVFLSTEKGP